MATSNSLKQQMNNAPEQGAKTNTLSAILKMPSIQNRFEEVLGKKSSNFISSLITLSSNDPMLSDAEPMSVISGAFQAAQLDLPLEKAFGFVYLIPFNTKNKQTGQWEKKAQFILGYRGYIQLAQRSGQYKTINVTTVYEGELKSWNRFDETIEINQEGRSSDKVVGYYGYFEMLNGYKKAAYWTKEEVESHRVANNKAKDKKALSGVWKSNYDAMGEKTVLRNLLSKWGILSIEMQRGVLSDESATEFESNGTVKDVTQSFADEVPKQAVSDQIDHKSINPETGEIIEDAPKSATNGGNDYYKNATNNVK